MADRDAGQKEMLESEYEMLFCVRDLIKIYEKQLVSLYGRTTKHLAETLTDIDRRIEETERKLETYQ